MDHERVGEKKLAVANQCAMAISSNERDPFSSLVIVLLGEDISSNFSEVHALKAHNELLSGVKWFKDKDDYHTLS